MADINNKLFGSAAGNIKSVDFTNSKIETFTKAAFSGCNGLEKITFGETCKELKRDALNDCPNLKQIIFKGTTTPTIEKQENNFSSVIIEVPEGKEQAYQDAFDVDNPGATVTAEEDILRYTSNDSLLGNEWLFDKDNGAAAKWSETEVPGEIPGEELLARFSWSGKYKGELVSGTFDAKIEKNGYNGKFVNMTGTEVFPNVGKNGKLLVSDREQTSLLFTIQPYSEISENTEYTDQGYTYSFVNIEQPVYDNSTYEGVVVLKDNVTSVGDGAFENDDSLTTIKLPQQITSINNTAFQSCSSLTSINIPNSVTSIGDYAFMNCTGLTSINIPDSVTEIDADAFYACSGLTSVLCRATVPPTLRESPFNRIATDTCQVPANSVSVYETAQWGGFKTFVEISE